MIETAIRVPTMKTAIWMTTRLDRCTLGSLIELVGHHERIRCGVGAGQLTDGPPPLEFQLREIPLEPGAREERLVETTERQVDDGGEICVIPAVPLGQRALRERVGRQHIECP